jgi:hypothetical protein
MDKTFKFMAGAVLLCTMIVGSVIIIQIGMLPPTIPFEEIDSGWECNILTRVSYVIEDVDSWSTLWTNMWNVGTYLPEVPFVNFTSEVVFAVFLGEFYTGGYSATITRITLSEDGLEVHVREVHPGSNCGVTMAFTQPYCVVKAAVKPVPSVSFEYNLVIRNCL